MSFFGSHAPGSGGHGNKRSRSQYSTLVLCFLVFFLWTLIVIHFAADEAHTESTIRRGTSMGLRPRGVQVLPISGHSKRSASVYETDGSIPKSNVRSSIISHENERPRPVPVVDGFENPNGLPKLPRLGPPSFFDILAPPYYGKSPVDGSRNYEPDSTRRTSAGCPVPFDGDVMQGSSDGAAQIPQKLADHISQSQFQAKLVYRETPLCSYGPEEFVPALVQNGFYAAYTFHQVCMTFNVDSSKKVQRGLLYFDPLNHHPKRCVACPNPIEMQRWGDHACGLMWSHQINSKSLSDFASCYNENLKFETRIGQRQSPGSDVKAGIFYSTPVLALSFAHKNPGHQMYDSLFTLMPLIVAYRSKPIPFLLAVHQNPTCPEDEWFCAILRRINFIRDDNLIPMFPGYVTCFKDLIVPKWGIARDIAMPPRLLNEFREVLFESFGFNNNSKATGTTLLLYAHDTKSVEVNQHRRIWLAMRQGVAESALIRDAYKTVTVIDDFARLTTEDQARAFYEADVIVMPHGGQFGNAMFARPGTLLLEIVCSGYSHLGMTNGGKDLYGSIPKGLGLIHVIVVPCSCGKRSDVDSDFTFGPKSLTQVVEAARTLQPGTHLAARILATKSCFGNDE